MVDSLSRQLINTYQGGFPLSLHPFAVAAEELGVTESTLINMLKTLLETGALSRFGPLYDASKLGGAFTLAAFEVPESEFDSVSEYVNSFHEVAHNYKRDHQLNMWFVLACDKQENIITTLDKIEAYTGLTVYNFPKTSEFYIGLWLELNEEGKVSTKSIPAQSYPIYPMPLHPAEAQLPPVSSSESKVIDELDQQIIKATQAGLPLVNEPYAVIAEQVSSTAMDVVSRLRDMLDNGIIRRIGVVPNHYKLGLKGNGMTVWNVADPYIKMLGDKVGMLDFVSHAYERPRHLPLWPYNLFAMVHGENREDVKEKIEIIADILGDQCSQFDVLFSSAILKKTGLRLLK